MLDQYTTVGCRTVGLSVVSGGVVIGSGTAVNRGRASSSPCVLDVCAKDILNYPQGTFALIEDDLARAPPAGHRQRWIHSRAPPGLPAVCGRLLLSRPPAADAIVVQHPVSGLRSGTPAELLPTCP